MSPDDRQQKKAEEDRLRALERAVKYRWREFQTPFGLIYEEVWVPPEHIKGEGADTYLSTMDGIVGYHLMFADSRIAEQVPKIKKSGADRVLDYRDDREHSGRHHRHRLGDDSDHPPFPGWHFYWVLRKQFYHEVGEILRQFGFLEEARDFLEATEYV